METYLPIKETFVRIARRVPGVVYAPAEEVQTLRTAVLVMHSDEDYLTCPTGAELSRRGCVVLCANVMNKEGVFFSQAEKMHAVKAAVAYLRSRKDVGKICLMGHSGGATLMTAYQAIAENGPEVFMGEEKILPYTDTEPMLPADGLLLFDPNWGNAIMQLFSLDPAVTDETTGKGLDPRYDLFEPANGFDPNGSRFSEDFIRRFQQKQGERNQAILTHALERFEAIQAGKGLYADDEPLVIPGADQGFLNNKLYAQDTRLMAHTEGEYPLLHGDGTETVEVIRSLRGPENPVSLTDRFCGGARMMTVMNYLSSYAVRTDSEYGYDESSVYGIDWSSTYNSPVGNVEHIHVPTLIVGMTAGWEYLASETIYRHCAAQDKHIAFVEGATHKFYPDRAREAYPGQFGDTIKTLHDYAARWLADREG